MFSKPPQRLDPVGLLLEGARDSGRVSPRGNECLQPIPQYGAQCLGEAPRVRPIASSIFQLYILALMRNTSLTAFSSFAAHKELHREQTWAKPQTKPSAASSAYPQKRQQHSRSLSPEPRQGSEPILPSLPRDTVAPKGTHGGSALCGRSLAPAGTRGFGEALRAL